MAETEIPDLPTEITKQSVDFGRWYIDVVRRAELADYSPVKGCMVIRPYGYAIWELMQQALDKRFKATGHVNAYFPLFIPESLLMKESQHVEGFAPQVAWVTQGGTEKLEERLVVRPTSETIIGTMYAKWVHSWRDLPILINQWANVVRWEKVTRLFLRTTEFLWQEGHTAHATADEGGLILPPRVAPYQVVMVPIPRGNWKETVLPKAREIRDTLEARGVRVMLDDRDSQTPGWKFNEWEMRGVPLRLEIGPKDLEKSQVVIARRDTREKSFVPMDGLAAKVEETLATVQQALFDRGVQFRTEHT